MKFCIIHHYSQALEYWSTQSPRGQYSMYSPSILYVIYVYLAIELWSCHAYISLWSCDAYNSLWPCDLYITLWSCDLCISLLLNYTPKWFFGYLNSMKTWFSDFYCHKWPSSKLMWDSDNQVKPGNTFNLSCDYWHSLSW